MDGNAHLDQLCRRIHERFLLFARDLSIAKNGPPQKSDTWNLENSKEN